MSFGVNDLRICFFARTIGRNGRLKDCPTGRKPPTPANIDGNFAGKPPPCALVLVMTAFQNSRGSAMQQGREAVVRRCAARDYKKRKSGHGE
jgi:hypothetical protein